MEAHDRPDPRKLLERTFTGLATTGLNRSPIVTGCLEFFPDHILISAAGQSATAQLPSEIHVRKPYLAYPLHNRLYYFPPLVDLSADAGPTTPIAGM